MDGGESRFPLGTDTQGRDMLSAMMYGSCLSLVVGFSAVALSVLLGVGLGVMAGYVGGWCDALAMRVADVQLTLPSILVALLVDGVVRSMLAREVMEEMAVYVIIFAIGISSWPQYARVTRGDLGREKQRICCGCTRHGHSPGSDYATTHFAKCHGTGVGDCDNRSGSSGHYGGYAVVSRCGDAADYAISGHPHSHWPAVFVLGSVVDYLFSGRRIGDSGLGGQLVGRLVA